MFFNKREKDFQDIKRAVEEPATLEEIEQLPQEEEQRDAPLFVKVDKYKDLIDLIREMKEFASGLKQTFAVINEAEALRNDALKIMRTTVQRLDKALNEMDTELVRPRGIDLDRTYSGGTEMRYIESSLTDLQRQLSVLRKDLQELGE